MSGGIKERGKEEAYLFHILADCHDEIISLNNSIQLALIRTRCVYGTFRWEEVVILVINLKVSKSRLLVS